MTRSQSLKPLYYSHPPVKTICFGLRIALLEGLYCTHIYILCLIKTSFLSVTKRVSRGGVSLKANMYMHVLTIKPRFRDTSIIISLVCVYKHLIQINVSVFIKYSGKLSIDNTCQFNVGFVIGI